MRNFLPGYSLALMHLVRALSMVAQIRRARTAPDPDGPVQELRAELENSRAWLAARAVDMPANFAHLVHLIDAEIAWEQDDFRSAAMAFDIAGRRAGGTRRPWHDALIAERTGSFYLEHGLQTAGEHAMVQAKGYYQAWGATAKVAHLIRAHTFLDSPEATEDPLGRTRRPSIAVSSESLDVLAILRASQALASQTRLSRLRLVIVEQLSGLTGATQVEIAVRDEDEGEWFLLSSDDGEEPVPIEQAGNCGRVPITVFHYAVRTEEPVLVQDALNDERFGRDPYLRDLDRCSLLVVPMLTQGSVRAVLMLSNQHDSGAFTSDRLDAVMLITGQLIVSVTNALLYSSLERRVAERTTALGAANAHLTRLSTTDALTGLANRRRFDDVLQAQFKGDRRRGHSICLIMVDVDHFKLFNDHYGHQAGDECLRRVAAVLAGTTRDSDLACRYGGEEFAVILTDGLGAEVAAERIRADIEALQYPHAISELGVVTASIGWARLLPGEGDQAGDLIAHADAALYEAKRNGRNQVRAHHDRHTRDE
jgi:diguanylate cyclase (GGDEF)-like protein